MGDNADVENAGNPFEPFIESVRQQLEDQDPVFLIGVIVALAVVVITCGESFTEGFSIVSISLSRLYTKLRHCRDSARFKV